MTFYLFFLCVSKKIDDVFSIDERPLLCHKKNELFVKCLCLSVRLTTIPKFFFFFSSSLFSFFFDTLVKNLLSLTFLLIPKSILCVPTFSIWRKTQIFHLFHVFWLNRSFPHTVCSRIRLFVNYFDYAIKKLISF